MEFRLLGPIEVEDSHGTVPLMGGARHRTVLAALLLEAGRPVEIGKLVEAVWGDNPPATVRTQLQMCVSGLRRQLRLPIYSSHAGYTLEVDGTGADGSGVELTNIDVARFEALVHDVHANGARNGHGWVVKSLRSALDLWRGPALQGAPGLAGQAALLEELRLTAAERLFDAELELGRHDQIIAELSSYVQGSPLRERFHAQLMLALYRSSRQAEALRVYRELRAMLDQELGLEPSPDVQALERMMLVRDESLAPPQGSPGAVPLSEVRSAEDDEPEAPPARAELPAVEGSISGRQNEIRAARELLCPASGIGTPVVLLYGMPGVGKSRVAVQLAHELKDEFSDGTVFLDDAALAGSDQAEPVSPSTKLLEQLGVAEGETPATEEARKRMFLERVLGRRTLIVFDGLRTEEQVRKLIPRHAHCAVLITSRSNLSTLEGSTSVEIAAVDARTSLDMLSGLIGADRVAAEPQPARRIARSCDGLPVAVHIAGSRLRDDPGLSLGTLSAQLEVENSRLDALAHKDISLRRLLDSAYQSLKPVEQHTLRRLGLLRTPQQLHMLSPLLGVPDAVAEELVARLAYHQLLQVTESEDGPSYTMHSLLRLFARERAAEEEPLAQYRMAISRAAMIDGQPNRPPRQQPR